MELLEEAGMVNGNHSDWGGNLDHRSAIFYNCCKLHMFHCVPLTVSTYNLIERLNSECPLVTHILYNMWGQQTAMCLFAVHTLSCGVMKLMTVDSSEQWHHLQIVDWMSAHRTIFGKRRICFHFLLLPLRLPPPPVKRQCTHITNTHTQFLF